MADVVLTCEEEEVNNNKDSIHVRTFSQKNTSQFIHTDSSEIMPERSSQPDPNIFYVDEVKQTEFDL